MSSDTIPVQPSGLSHDKVSHDRAKTILVDAPWELEGAGRRVLITSSDPAITPEVMSAVKLPSPGLVNAVAQKDGPPQWRVEGHANLRAMGNLGVEAGSKAADAIEEDKLPPDIAKAIVAESGTWKRSAIVRGRIERPVDARFNLDVLADSAILGQQLPLEAHTVDDSETRQPKVVVSGQKNLEALSGAGVREAADMLAYLGSNPGIAKA
jgi:hypothetical protein